MICTGELRARAYTLTCRARCRRWLPFPVPGNVSCACPRLLSIGVSTFPAVSISVSTRRIRPPTLLFFGETRGNVPVTESEQRVLFASDLLGFRSLLMSMSTHRIHVREHVHDRVRHGRKCCRHLLGARPRSCHTVTASAPDGGWLWMSRLRGDSYLTRYRGG